MLAGSNGFGKGTTEKELKTNFVPGEKRFSL
jgi:hypothetical protein